MRPKPRTRSLLAPHNPALLQQFGVGPDTTATLLITAGENRELLHSEASFAALCGVSPSKPPPANSTPPP